MAVAPAPICDFGWKADDFSLPATDGKSYSLNNIAGENGTVIVFICNHCPYVIAILDRLVRDANALRDQGIGFAAICSNDATNYPADSFDNMGKMAQDAGFPFPYLHDEDQSVARAWGAVCTPDFFGFDKDFGLQYRGRLDESGARAGVVGARRDLFEAMTDIARTGKGPRDQIASMGCSIKWK